MSVRSRSFHPVLPSSSGIGGVAPAWLEGRRPARRASRALFDPRGDVVSAPELAMVMSGLGVGDDHTVVIVDDGCPESANAAARALARYGHRDVHVLEGGFARWVGEGRTTTRAIVRHRAASFTARVPS